MSGVTKSFHPEPLVTDQLSATRAVREIPLNIVQLGACPYPVPQGSQVYLRDTARALEIAGHRPQLMAYGYGAGADRSGLPLHRAWNPPGARNTAAGPTWAKPLQDAALVHALRRVCRESTADAVGAHNYEGLMVALASHVRPVVYHAHNAMADELPHYFREQPWARKLGAWLDQTFPRRADAVVTPHDRLRDYLVECGCDAERVHVIPPPLDATGFEPAPVGGASPVVLYAGNLDRYQNLPLLEAAMARVRAARPDTKLIVATASRETPFIADAVVEPTPDLAALQRALRRDAIFVCPRTSWSGYPIKLLNAMAAGLPIVCCDGSAHPVVSGETGLVVPDDAEAFADAILQLLDDPAMRAAMGAAGRARLLEKHAPADIGNRLSEVYQKFAAARAASV